PLNYPCPFQPIEPAQAHPALPSPVAQGNGGDAPPDLLLTAGRRPSPPPHRKVACSSPASPGCEIGTPNKKKNPESVTGRRPTVSLGRRYGSFQEQLNITKAIRDSIQLNFGECGLAACLGSLQVKYVNPITKICVIRVSREDHQKVWAAITMVRSIGKIPVSFNLRDMSGSIRACKKAALECEEAKFEYYKLAAGDRITPKFVETMKGCFDKIKGLES
ncbi:hypothetical protein E2562_003798, partial [Oryza meyeriana var. granulata]